MKRKIISSIIIFGTGFLIVLAYLFLSIVIPFLGLPNGKEILDTIRYIIYVICGLGILISFIYLAIKVVSEMKFQKYVIDELNSFGFRENLHNDFVKRKEKYKVKNELVYLESVNYLGIEKYSQADYQGVIDNFKEINIPDYYEKHKLDKGKAQLNHLIVICNMIDLLLTSYYKLGNMEDKADEIYPYLIKIHDTYITKYANLDATIIESKFMYALIKKNYAEAKVLLDLEGSKKGLVDQIAYLTNSVEYEYVMGTLTLERLEEMKNNCEPIIAKTLTKEYYRQNLNRFYENKLKALKGNTESQVSSNNETSEA